MRKSLNSIRMRNRYEKAAVFVSLAALGAYGIYFIIEVIQVLMDGT